jgi:hypothetical protein
VKPLWTGRLRCDVVILVHSVSGEGFSTSYQGFHLVPDFFLTFVAFLRVVGFVQSRICSHHITPYIYQSPHVHVMPIERGDLRIQHNTTQHNTLEPHENPQKRFSAPSFMTAADYFWHAALLSS